MPLPGGGSDKLGNRYEGRWTTHCIIDVMDEKADSIRLEQPGEDAFEFFLKRNGTTECHQVKRQKSSRGRWTLSSLQDKQVQVLQDFWTRLKQPDILCIFVSTQDADELHELAERSKNSLSWQEFERHYLNQTRAGHFSTLCQKWGNCSEVEAYEALKRVRVETVGESFLVEAIESRLSALVEGDPKTIRLELAELILERIHQELTAHDIWHYLLNERGYRRREWGKDEHVLAALDKANELYLSPLRDMSIGGHQVPRQEAETAFEDLTVKQKSVILLGEAGGGKTGVVVQVIDKLQQAGMPVLVFRVDRQDPTQLPDNVGQQLGLPGSPAIVLASIAQKRECVLVIDQLDAVSSVSGRNPEFFDCIHGIIQQAKAHPNIKLLLSCRKFDLENDSRLKKLTGEKGIANEIIIRRLPLEVVREALDNLELDVSRLSNRQLELLSIPLHLSLLAEIASDEDFSILDIETANDLFEKFWDYKQQQVRHRLGRSPKWTEVIDILCDYMSQEQNQGLSAPAQILDSHVDDAQAMASEHLLIWQEKRVSFFHESFFDYAFARRFTARGEQLLSFLLRSEQHLFRRAQVRQILLNERENDFEQYLRDLKELLIRQDIRFHLKQVVIALLGDLTNPKASEWDVIAPLLENPILSPHVWGMLRGATPWFKLLHTLGTTKEWLQDNSKCIDQALRVMSSLQDQASEIISELLEPLIHREKSIWHDRLRTFFNLSDNSSRCIFDLFLHFVGLGGFDSSEDVGHISRDFWLQIHSITNKHSEWACEAIKAYLMRFLDSNVNIENVRSRAGRGDFFPQSDFVSSVLQEVVEGSPCAFVRYILPVVMHTVELFSPHRGELPYPDLIWPVKYYGDSYDSDYEILYYLELALSKVASNFSDEFSEVAQCYLYHSNFETIQFLLVRAYTASGERFADEAIDYLCAKPFRFETGYSVCNGNIHAAPYWATRQMLETTTPYCSDENLLKLEKMLLDYYPVIEVTRDWETMQWCLRSYGYEQFVLLDGICESRHSLFVKKRLQEWRRKFISAKFLGASGKIEPPEAIEADFVQSPIHETAASKMNDQQWLKALNQYNHKNFKSWRKNQTFGGASSLSCVLEAETKKNPERFVKLLLQFPVSFNTVYFDAVLRGITEVELDTSLCVEVIRYCHQLPDKPCGRNICSLVQKLSQSQWPEDIYKIINWYAIHDPNPEVEQNNATSTANDLLSRGINSVRGGAASTIASLLFSDKNRASCFDPVLRQMAQDKSIAVRSYVVEALTALLNYNRDTAVEIFLRLCDTQYEVLLGTKTVKRFLHYALDSHFHQLKPLLDQMLTSTLADVVEGGASQCCVASLLLEEAKPLAIQCLTGTDSHRLAAAKVFSRNIRSAHFRQDCQEGLIQLFYDSEKSIKQQAAKCFFRMEGEELSNYLDLVNQFIASPAFLIGFHELIWAMERTTVRMPESVVAMCSRYVTALLEEYNQKGQVYKTDADSVSQLLLKAYSQSNRLPALQSQCLNLIDQLAEIGNYGLDKALQEYER